MLMLAQNNWNQLSPETQALVNPWLLRPDNGIGSPPSGVNFYTDTQIPNLSTLSTTHFLFHYLDDTAYPNDANRANAAFVAQLAIEAETVWTQETTTMGYTAPPSDGTLGGDGKYDIYLLDIGAVGIYGYVTGDPQVRTGSPYPNSVFTHMVLDNDFSTSQFSYPNSLTPAQVTLAHEFFHSIQMGYDGTEFPAVLESLSTWMEDKVYPNIKDNLQYIGEVYTDSDGNSQFTLGESFIDRNGNGLRESGSQDYPELPLDSFGLTATGLEQYGRFVWIRYLSDKHGDILIKNILTAMGQTSGNNTYTAIDTSLKNIGSSLSIAFHEFGIWNIDITQYQNGADYPIAWGDNLFQGGANISSNASIALQPFSGKQKHLSTVYELIQNPVGTYTFTTTGTAKLSVLSQNTAGGAYSLTPIPLNAGQAVWTPPTGLSKITFVISNTSATNDNMTWQLTDGVTPALPVLSSTNPPIASNSGGSSGGCLTSTTNNIYIMVMALILTRLTAYQTKKHPQNTCLCQQGSINV
ncbi:MXAN_6640 family putative metalloprotease [Ghiorsea bivora]|uniref:MXAN_6640 family putative metalloprotease n=1 Tax=Ghiorsea bivora TaxID=1485545 RepID=UPI0012FD7F5C|nr:MXAN_6640 family putative metalloprotease [Ghiorsea bivora]